MAKIFIYDEFSPQDTAMMQALYSRSAKSVVEHVEKVKSSGSGKFMEQFYVGYGHQSIADCGSTTIFIEGLSILADKAVQDWQMYSGQETSTRYIDMSQQAIIDPIGTEESKNIHTRWMDFYITSQAEMEEFLKNKFPKKPTEDDNIYNKAIKARTFDILRGFLPAGITTQLSWHTNLRQASDKLQLMRHNPIPEIREVAENILAKLKEKYSSSFSHPTIPEQEAYREKINQEFAYYTAKQPINFACRVNIDDNEIAQYKDIINARPAKTGLPAFLGEMGNIVFDFLLDFGSFRDIQRHRNGVCRIPLLTTNYGFNNWYLDQLSPELKEKALQLIEEQKRAIEALSAEQNIKQYYIAMGFNVTCRNSYALPATVYVIELRSGISVHPTLRQIAHQMSRALEEKFPWMKLYTDYNQDDWDIRRGLQDITKK